MSHDRLVRFPVHQEEAKYFFKQLQELFDRDHLHDGLLWHRHGMRAPGGNELNFFEIAALNTSGEDNPHIYTVAGWARCQRPAQFCLSRCPAPGKHETLAPLGRPVGRRQPSHMVGKARYPSFARHGLGSLAASAQRRTNSACFSISAHGSIRRHCPASLRRRPQLSQSSSQTPRCRKLAAPNKTASNGTPPTMGARLPSKERKIGPMVPPTRNLRQDNEEIEDPHIDAHFSHRQCVGENGIRQSQN